MPPFAPTLLKHYSQGDFLDMDYIEALYFYNEAILDIREAELREIWLAVTFNSFGNSNTQSWEEFKSMYSLRGQKTKRNKDSEVRRPGIAKYRGVDLARMGK